MIEFTHITRVSPDYLRCPVFRTRQSLLYFIQLLRILVQVVDNMAWGIKAPRGPQKEEGADVDGIEPVSSSNSGTNAHDTAVTEKKAPYSEDIDITAAAADIPRFVKSHQYDPNLPQAKIDILRNAEVTGDAEAIRETEELFAENSPYEEVRAAVRSGDSGGPANTVRAWTLGMIFVTICSGLNMFLSMRFVRAFHFQIEGH
jgi:hypothetical protein